MTRKQRHLEYEECPVEATIDLIGGKWKCVIINLLGEQTMRFGALRKRLTKVTQRTLTNQLREMEADGLVSREIFAEVPPRVEYSLTKRGRSLMPIILNMAEWGNENVLKQDDKL